MINVTITDLSIDSSVENLHRVTKGELFHISQPAELFNILQVYKPQHHSTTYGITAGSGNALSFASKPGA